MSVLAEQIASIALFLLPILSALWFRFFALRASNVLQTTAWFTFRTLTRPIWAISLASWWAIWDLNFRNTFTSVLSRSQVGSLANMHPEAVYFWLAPIASIGFFFLICFSTDKRILRPPQRSGGVLRLVFWSLLTLVVPLLMAAAGFDEILSGTSQGVVWIAGAGVVGLLSQGQLNKATGIKTNRLKSGVVRSRVLAMAKRMGVAIRRVYLVPEGREHLTGAFALLNRSVAVTDNWGKHFTRKQADFAIAHELAHVEQNHGLKELSATLAIFSFATLTAFLISPVPASSRPPLDFALMIVPMIANLAVSRQFERVADHRAAKFTRDPESAIRALAKLYRISRLPKSVGRFAELFRTHPSLLPRAQAIARDAQMPVARLNEILKNEETNNVPEPT